MATGMKPFPQQYEIRPGIAKVGDVKTWVDFERDCVVTEIAGPDGKTHRHYSPTFKDQGKFIPYSTDVERARIVFERAELERLKREYKQGAEWKQIPEFVPMPKFKLPPQPVPAGAMTFEQCYQLELKERQDEQDEDAIAYAKEAAADGSR